MNYDDKDKMRAENEYIASLVHCVHGAGIADACERCGRRARLAPSPADVREINRDVVSGQDYAAMQSSRDRTAKRVDVLADELAKLGNAVEEIEKRSAMWEEAYRALASSLLEDAEARKQFVPLTPDTRHRDGPFEPPQSFVTTDLNDEDPGW